MPRRKSKPVASTGVATLLHVLAVLVGLTLAAGDASAQRRQVSLEVTPFHGTIGYGWITSPTQVLGIEVGAGIPEFDRTLMPDDESLIDFVHIGAFMRRQPVPSIEVDARVKLGLAELDGCSGCLPGGFGAVSGAVFWGGRRFKVGPRLTAGMIRERGETTFVLNLTPIAALFTYAW